MMRREMGLLDDAGEMGEEVVRILEQFVKPEIMHEFVC